jgi:DNA-binding SARP family transcriptional activator/TolB-like protein
MRAELRILGHTELSLADNLTGGAVLRQPKRLALLAYLALAASDGFRRRDQIVGLFWPEKDQLHARTQLRKALHGLRATIGADAFLARGDEEIRLDTTVVWCDAVAFRRHCDAREWSEAVSLYRGDLLEGLFPGGVGEEFETWLAEQRAGLHALAARAAWESSALADLAGRREEAITLARRAAELNPDDEEGFRRLIAALDRYGDRAGALRMFSDWQSRLQKEFGADPAPETRRLVRQVQASRKGESMETPPWAIAQTSRAIPEREIATGDSQRNNRPLRISSYRLVFSACVALLAIALIVLAPLSRRESAQPRTLAVLPLRGLGDSIATLTGEAIAEELITSLTQLHGLDVRSSARSKAVLDSARNVEEIGRRLKVRHVIDGSVQRRADKLRVNVRLLRVSDASTLWARSLDLDVNDLLSSQARIAATVVDALAPLLAQTNR